MKTYGNRSGNSGIAAFETGADWIAVRFQDGAVYRYSDAGAGRENVEWMKRLAAAGRGLATFINQHPEVRNGYDR